MIVREKCKSCQCSRCDNDSCEWRRCRENKPTDECYQEKCGNYDNLQEDIEEGFFDGYGD